MSESVQRPDKSGVEEQPSQETQPSGTVTRYQSLALLGSSLLAAVSTLSVSRWRMSGRMMSRSTMISMVCFLFFSN